MQSFPHPEARSRWRFARTLTILLWLALPGFAQIIHIQGGGSTLIDANGGSVDFETSRYSGAFGAGLIRGRFEYGGVLRTEIDGFKIVGGDEIIRFDLPTDIFSAGHYVFSRGGGMRKSWERSTLQAFGGVTSTFLGAPYFTAARPKDPFGLVFYDYKISDTLTFLSRNVFSSKSTFLDSLEWKPKQWFHGGITGGIGSGAPYGAIGFAADRRRYTLHVSYISAGSSFRRVKAAEPVVSEPDRENLLFDYRPFRRFSISLGRQNVLSPLTANTTQSLRAVTNSGGVNLAVFGGYLGATVLYSEVEKHVNRAVSVFANRSFGPRIDTTFTYYRNRPDIGNITEGYTGSVREKITRRLSVSQYVTRSNGQTSYSFGGDFTSNRFSIGVSQETSYVPFRSQSAGGPFVNTQNIHISIRPFGNVEFTGQTNIAPDGKVKYTVAGSDYIYRSGGGQSGESRLHVRISDSVVKGIALDEDSQPVAGAAFKIDGVEVFTDSEGRFLARFSKNGSQPFHVALEDFLSASYYEVASAPQAVDAVPEDQAQEVTIRLRRTKPPSPPPPKPKRPEEMGSPVPMEGTSDPLAAAEKSPAAAGPPGIDSPPPVTEGLGRPFPMDLLLLLARR